MTGVAVATAERVQECGEHGMLRAEQIETARPDVETALAKWRYPR